MILYDMILYCLGRHDPQTRNLEPDYKQFHRISFSDSKVRTTLSSTTGKYCSIAFIRILCVDSKVKKTLNSVILSRAGQYLLSAYLLIGRKIPAHFVDIA